MDEVNEDSESEREPPKEFSLSLFLQSLLPYIESPWLRDWSLPGYMMEGGRERGRIPSLIPPTFTEPGSLNPVKLMD